MLQKLNPHGPAKVRKLGWKITQIEQKLAFLGKLAKSSRGYLLQFCSDLKKSDMKNDQKSKGYKIGLVELVWPQLSISPDLYGEFQNRGHTSLTRPIL